MASGDLPQRTETHVLEERSRRAVRSFFPPEWVVNDIADDYGEDLHVEIYRDSVPTGFEFAVQIKATASAASDGSFSVQVPVKTVNYLLQRAIPALVVGYNGVADAVHGVWLDEYVAAQELKRARLDKQK